MNNKFAPFLIVLLVAASFLGGSLWTKVKYLETRDQSLEPRELAEEPSPAILGETKPEYETTVGNFLVLENEVCQENGKPIIYFFGSESCSYCLREHPIFNKAIVQFGDLISVHDNMDSQTDGEVFQKYSQINRGGIPFLLLGCRYARSGSFKEGEEKTELKALTELICELTDSQPKAVCQ